MRGVGVAPSRARLVDAAVACVLEQGWEATSMQAVRRRAGVSNGSLFHYFPTRGDLAAAVVGAGLADHQGALWGELHTSTGPRDGVTRLVTRHLRWVEEHPRLARLLLTAPVDVLRGSIDERTAADNRGFFAAVADWLRGHGWSDRPDLAVVVALWIGPAQEYSRHWLARPAGSPTLVADDLADAAWRTLGPLLTPRKE
ncbi:TetR family transcriptional regulator [Frankia sp. CcI156]|uniref:Transcriptional regulator, TetR family n=2 Tax=Frankia casuarinae (strain DSM 45818 / CECT 9043 / HFP020203 / CcI3) TaxID=106370 RepID=Q2JAL4_FRACC|nr:MULTISPECIES: TetR/AcrR family transcriptional regulator [Frankia]ABD11678.1 transcriptional regulator, TetR family [Frankia casuarinae]ETA01385.1 transcriptional regulator, TetR family [Frankia sp. CcI6]EYT89838.1 transcriptional regulator, TetR family [Frankia casuarinae]KDA42550.1 transcriptional regulator, TetR family [Frankia sp. BMG5.23]KEZ35577.1 transcriptional regulator, TetR family [Frankia sp. CeD]